MHQNGFDGYFFFIFLVIAGNEVEKERSLELGKTWFGRRFCCLVIYANLHSLPCICIKIVPTCPCFTFLAISAWQNMVWKVFLLFGDLC